MYICICICLHVCMYVYIYMQIYIYICIYMYVNVCKYVHVYICIRIHVYIYVNIYLYVHMYMYVHIYIYVYVYMYICIYVHMYICMCMYIYIRIWVKIALIHVNYGPFPMKIPQQVFHGVSESNYIPIWKEPWHICFPGLRHDGTWFTREAGHPSHLRARCIQRRYAIYDGCRNCRERI